MVGRKELNEPKYPNIEVPLSQTDGNALAIVGRVTRYLKKAGVPDSEIAQYRAESLGGDYNNLLRVAMEWVEVT